MPSWRNLLRRARAAEAGAAPPPAPAAASEPRGVSIDPGFAAGFRDRAERRDGLPILGPWAGLAETARVAVSSSRMPETMVTSTWSASLAQAHPEEPAALDTFVSGLPSLFSYSDPFGTTGEGGGPFRDSLPSGAAQPLATGGSRRTPIAGQRPRLAAAVEASGAPPRGIVARKLTSPPVTQRPSPPTQGLTPTTTAAPLAQGRTATTTPVPLALIATAAGRTSSPSAPAAPATVDAVPPVRPDIAEPIAQAVSSGSVAVVGAAGRVAAGHERGTADASPAPPASAATLPLAASGAGGSPASPELAPPRPLTPLAALADVEAVSRPSRAAPVASPAAAEAPAAVIAPVVPVADSRAADAEPPIAIPAAPDTPAATRPASLAPLPLAGMDSLPGPARADPPLATAALPGARTAADDTVVAATAAAAGPATTATAGAERAITPGASPAPVSLVPPETRAPFEFEPPADSPGAPPPAPAFSASPPQRSPFPVGDIPATVRRGFDSGPAAVSARTPLADPGERPAMPPTTPAGSVRSGRRFTVGEPRAEELTRAVTAAEAPVHRAPARLTAEARPPGSASPASLTPSGPMRTLPVVAGQILRRQVEGTRTRAAQPAPPISAIARRSEAAAGVDVSRLSSPNSNAAAGVDVSPLSSPNSTAAAGVELSPPISLVSTSAAGVELSPPISLTGGEPPSAVLTPAGPPEMWGHPVADDVSLPLLIEHLPTPIAVEEPFSAPSANAAPEAGLRPDLMATPSLAQSARALETAPAGGLSRAERAPATTSAPPALRDRLAAPAGANSLARASGTAERAAAKGSALPAAAGPLSAPAVAIHRNVDTAAATHEASPRRDPLPLPPVGISSGTAASRTTGGASEGDVEAFGSLRLGVAGVRAAGGSPGAGRVIIQRAPDGESSEATATMPESVPATAGGSGEPAPAAGPDIDKLAERVWQVVRRKLTLERERRRGMP